MEGTANNMTKVDHQIFIIVDLYAWVGTQMGHTFYYKMYSRN